MGTLVIRLTANSTQLVKGIDDAITKVDSGTRRMSSSLAGMALKAGAAFAAVATAVSALSVKAFIEFESAFAGVRKTVTASEEEFKSLSRAIRNMAKDMPVSATELAKIMELGGQLGVEGAENLDHFTRTISKFRTATGIASEEAATAFARISNLMQEPIKNIDRMGSVVAQLGDAGAATEKEILEMANRIAGAGKIAGLTTSEVFSIASAFSSAGIEAEAGGTAIQKVLLDLNNAGLRGIDPFVGLINDLADAGSKSADVLKGLGFEEARMQRAFLGVAGAGGLLAQQLKIGNKEWEENSRLTKEAAERNKTFGAQLEISKNRLNDLMIDLGEALAGPLKTLNNMWFDLTQTTDGFNMSMKELVDIAVAGVSEAFFRMADGAQFFLKAVKLAHIGYVSLVEAFARGQNMVAGSINDYIKKQDELNAKMGVPPTGQVLGFSGNKIPTADVDALVRKREQLTAEFNQLLQKPPISQSIKEFAEHANNGLERVRLQAEKTIAPLKEVIDLVDDTKRPTGTVSELQRQNELRRKFDLLPNTDAIGRATSVRGPSTFGFGLGNPALDDVSRLKEEEDSAKAHLKVMQEISEAKILTKKEETERLTELQAAYTENLKKFKQAEYEVAITSSKLMFDDLASIAEAFAGKQSGVYKAMFATSKAFAIAESIIKIQQGIASAASLGWPLGIAAMAGVVAATSNIVSSIQSVKLELGGKRAAGGSVSAGTPYLVGERGPEPFIPASNGRIMSNAMMLAGAGRAPTIIVNNNGASVDVNDARWRDEKIIEVTVGRIVSDVANGRGAIPKTMERTYNLKRGAR